MAVASAGKAAAVAVAAGAWEGAERQRTWAASGASPWPGVWPVPSEERRQTAVEGRPGAALVTSGPFGWTTGRERERRVGDKRARRCRGGGGAKMKMRLTLFCPGGMGCCGGIPPLYMALFCGCGGICQPCCGCPGIGWGCITCLILRGPGELKGRDFGLLVGTGGWGGVAKDESRLFLWGYD